MCIYLLFCLYGMIWVSLLPFLENCIKRKFLTPNIFLSHTFDIHSMHVHSCHLLMKTVEMVLINKTNQNKSNQKEKKKKKDQERVFIENKAIGV